MQGGTRGGIPAGADVARVLQLAVRVVVAEQEAADFRGRARAVGEAADHELLARVGFELEPGRRAGRHVGRVDALGDDAFQPQGAGRREDAARIPIEVRAEVHALDALGLDKLLEQRPPGVQRHVAQVVAGEIEQVEQEVVDAVSARRIERVLQGVEVGRAVLVQYDDLAIEPRGLDAEGLDCRGEGFELGGPVIAVAGEEASATRLDTGQQPVPVELDFIAPLSAGRHARGQGGELRRQCRGQVGFDGAGQIGSRLWTSGPRGRRDAAARRTFLESAQGLFDHAVGQGDDHVVLRQRPRPGVALLEEKPRFLLVAWLGDTYQFPQAISRCCSHPSRACARRSRPARRLEGGLTYRPGLDRAPAQPPRHGHLQAREGERVDPRPLGRRAERGSRKVGSRGAFRANLLAGVTPRPPLSMRWRWAAWKRCERRGRDIPDRRRSRRCSPIGAKRHASSPSGVPPQTWGTQGGPVSA